MGDDCLHEVRQGSLMETVVSLYSSQGRSRGTGPSTWVARAP